MTRVATLLVLGALAGSAAAQDLTSDTPGGFLDLREPVIKKRPTGTKVRARVSASVININEDQKTPVTAAGVPAPEARTASNDTIQWLDLRGTFQTSQVRGPGLASLGDLRVRVTQDEPRALALALGTPTGGQPPAGSTHGLGIDGGKELDLRQLYAGWAGQRSSFYAGRMIVQEADGETIDGLRYLRKVGAEQDGEVSLYGGAVRDPFSRTIQDDYGPEHKPAIGAGSTGAYHSSHAYGSFGLGLVLPQGLDDGDSVNDTTGTRGTRTTEKPRVFATSNGYWRLRPQWDFYHYAVVDVASEDGFGVRSLHAQLGYRPSLAFHAEVGYSHLSTIAIETYLFDLLKSPDPRTVGTVQSNLLVQRVSRDELHGQVDFTLGERRYDVYALGSLRRRSLLDAAQDPSFTTVPAQNAADLTVGLRDRRSFKKLRLGTSVTEILDYRADSTIFHVEAGRDFMKDDRLAIDTSLDYQITKDHGPKDATMVCSSKAFVECWGRYSGSIYDLGVTGVYHPSMKWLALIDGHVVYDSGSSAPEVRLTNTAQSPIATYIVFLKGQYTY